MKLNWSESDDRAPLAGGAVHVWAVSLVGDGTSRSALEQVLSPDERARADRFVRAEAGRSFVTARAALRSILGRYLHRPPADVPIVAEADGKPQLADAAASDLRFNLAHSGELALVAVTRSGEIGVDIERLRPVVHWQDIASRYFHPAETAAIGADASPTPVNFFRCWTRKEAVLKAIGVGIIFPLDAFRVPLEEHAPGWIDVPAQGSNPATRYWVESLDPCAGYVGAIATTHQVDQVEGFTYRA